MVQIPWLVTWSVCRCVVFLTGILLTSLTPAQTQLGIADDIDVLHERLVGDTPGEGCCGEVTPAVTIGEAAGTVGTEGEGEEVAIQQGVVGTANPADKHGLAFPLSL